MRIFQGKAKSPSTFRIVPHLYLRKHKYWASRKLPSLYSFKLNIIYGKARSNPESSGMQACFTVKSFVFRLTRACRDGWVRDGTRVEKRRRRRSGKDDVEFYLILWAFTSQSTTLFDSLLKWASLKFWKALRRDWASVTTAATSQMICDVRLQIKSWWSLNYVTSKAVGVGLYSTLFPE